MQKPYDVDVDKMFTYLRAYLKGANMQQSLRALVYAREKHSGQFRKDGKPYIAHPLSMACYAAALGIKDDQTMAIILLHDVCEDCSITFNELPFEDRIKVGVRYVTITKFDTDRSKDETKRRYYSELIYDEKAVITKGIDKYMNLSDMVFSLSRDAIGKNTAESDILLLPVLKEAKEKYCDLSDIIYTIRTNIKSVCGVYRVHYEEEYNKWVGIFTGTNNSITVDNTLGGQNEQ